MTAGDAWVLRQEVASEPGWAGTVFVVANGFVGVRGLFGEPGAGTFVNGFYETFGIDYPEAGYGFARAGQTIVSAPDSSGFSLAADGEPLEPGQAVRCRRALDLRRGVLTGEYVWQTREGARVTLSWWRMASFARRELVVSGVDVVADRPVRVELGLGLRETPADPALGGDDPRRATWVAGHAPVRGWQEFGEGTLGLAERCEHSGRTVVALAEIGATNVRGDDPPAPRSDPLSAPDQVTAATRAASQVTTSTRLTPHGCERVFGAHIGAGEKLGVTSVVAYAVGGPSPSGRMNEGRDDLIAQAREALARGAAIGADGLRAEQAAWMGSFWADADVRIGGQPDLQRAVRWSVFQLAQATACADGRGIPAKGLTGDGYCGHSFWDSEIFVLPFLTYTRPAWARAALGFRHAMLDDARALARLMSEDGALFPWRTIDGREASAYFPAGTAQYHIDADVAHAVWQHAQATGDRDYLASEGVDVLVETARLWASLGTWSARTGDRAFHIDEVTGPDEYTALVDDNAYTNVMAAKNLRHAADALDLLDDAARDRAVVRLGIGPGEPDEWRAMAAGMHRPYDAALGVTPQDAAFLGHERWDVAGTPADHFPLLLHYHPLVLYRFQVLKQADVVMAMVLAPDEFTPALKRANFDYYEPLTTGDSTLSGAAQAIIAAEVGHEEAALRHLAHAAGVDLANGHGNTRDGVHVASAGGLWNAVVYGFAGLRDVDGLSFDPRLPASWCDLSFTLAWGASRVAVHVTPGAIEFTLREGPPVTLGVRGADVCVNGTVLVDLEKETQKAQP